MTENEMSRSTPPAPAAKRRRWALQPLQLAEPWCGFVLTQPYPIPRDDRQPYQAVVHALLRLLPESQPPFVREAFLQMDRVDFQQDIPLVQENASVLGDYGLGYYPHLPPPTTWTKEEFQALFPPQKMRPLYYDIMRVESSDPAAIPRIANLFLGSGAYAEAFCGQAHTFYRLATETFKPLITDKMMRLFRYYAPLLQRHAMEGSRLEDIDQWTCGASVYMRESNEDNGLFVLRRGKLDTYLRELVEGRAYPEADFVLG